ncbi:hypothetical protein RND71_014946 [Anisodus tanguticus]|uniref:Uncharacterized protein n=1 Tax=Anisodus tanguticus TaxID=243964 RepID=A0AAE1SC83_9SOLA|nr:hypothetical protein RND71_014946 [Anisodus tanguticus]
MTQLVVTKILKIDENKNDGRKVSSEILALKSDSRRKIDEHPRLIRNVVYGMHSLTFVHGTFHWDKRHPGQPKPRLFTVGRLDVATTGLIIVTNDAISDGTVIDGVHCSPDNVELLPRQPDKPRPRLRIVVHEGRNHEVRELVKNAGLQLRALKRIRIGGFRRPADLAPHTKLPK